MLYNEKSTLKLNDFDKKKPFLGTPIYSAKHCILKSLKTKQTYLMSQLATILICPNVFLDIIQYCQY